ncbi:hypothetical protein CDAR_257991 [Caerostris darwini]|uniref:Uncharacterized protein n=1 Tax=Caerostris darwini TaxID=1538125 RepID=A0AAV4WXS5_9ARAC|nr:hypothetical protein CDAR_257991 [Caerostris darwini]
MLLYIKKLCLATNISSSSLRIRNNCNPTLFSPYFKTNDNLINTNPQTQITLTKTPPTNIYQKCNIFSIPFAIPRTIPGQKAQKQQQQQRQRKPSTPLQVRYEDHAWNASYGGRKVWSYILEPEMPKGPVPIVPVSKQQGKEKTR